MAVTMADITKLRKMSGAGMMDCKKALTESDGDIEKAMEIIRFQLPRRPRLPPLFPRRNRNAIHAPSAQRSIRCNPRHNRLCRSC